jgi:hypothetical protein
MAEINQEPATKLKDRSLRMAGKAMCTLPTCVAARMPAMIARNTMDHTVEPGWAATAGCWTGGNAPAEMGFSLSSLEGAKESVVFPTEGGRDGCFKVGLPGLAYFNGNEGVGKNA